MLTLTSSVAEMFKTPGKLRGKTPRTIRRNPLEMRAPLTDIFSASPRNAASTPQAKVFREKATTNFEIAKDLASSPAPPTLGPARISPEKSASPTRKPVPKRAPPPSFQDSGYHSQNQSQQATQEATQRYSSSVSPERPSPQTQQQSAEDNLADEQRPTTADSSYTAETHQTDDKESQAQLRAESSIIHNSPNPTPVRERSQHMSSPVNWTPGTAHTLKHASPGRSSPFHSSPHKSFHEPIDVDEEHGQVPQSEKEHVEVFDEAGTPSDGSSPVRQVIRKSSLSFASLPQREPLTVKKSIGQRTSRGSHFEASRSSYYGNVGDKKSLGGQRAQEAQDDHDEMDLDDAESSAKRSSKTYTQRLQDQINLLGQVKTTQSRLSKSITNLAPASTAQPTYPTLPQEEEHLPSSPMRTVRSERSFAAPGAYPEEEDSWIGGPPPATTSIPINKALSPRQQLVKSYTVDVMEDLRGNGGSIGGREFKVPQREPRQPSPMVEKPISAVPDYARTLGHLKSQSTTSFHSPQRKEEMRGFETLKKTISIENPHRDGHDQDYHYSPSKSPAQSLRGSPLKAAKDKLSSILKTSKGLFASSAAVSADAKMAAAGSLPVGSRNVSREEQALRDAQNDERLTTSLYPALSNPFQNQSRIPDSPSKKNSIRKLKEREAKEARVMAEQLTKLDRERTKEAEKARVYSQQERERVASMERKVAAQREAARQDEERRAAMQREEERREAERREAHRLEEERAAAEEEEHRRIATEREAERKAASTPSLPRPTRSSPRKTKAQLEAEGRAAAAKRADEMDVDNADSQMMPPPSTIGRSQIARPKSAAASRLQRPTSKQAAPAARGAPVVIRVNTGSRPFQPSTAALSASLGDSLPPAPVPNPVPPPSRGGRPATKAIVPKASSESLKGAAANSKVRALESAARKREQEEREAREKREAKVAMTQQLEAKRNAQKAEERKREIEKAKERRPPPPPARPNPHADREKPLPVPPANQRMNQELQRPLQDRNESYQSTKALPKRPLGGEENQRPGIPRNGPSYQQQSEAKRRKTEDEYDFDMPSPPRGAAAPPIRQSSIRKQVSHFSTTSSRAPSHPPRTAPIHISDISKDAPMKSLFPSGYAAAQGEGVRHVPNAIPQHMQQKPTRPMENKAPPQGFSTNASHKTPARAMGAGPNGKSTSKRSAKESPRYVNGENIDLPEIPSDSDDSDSDSENKNFAVPEWAESPNLAAGIIAQEGRDPMTVFGPPAELKMEEVFRNKERWGRFRQRTSSANWSGQDRLTEEEVKRDLEMRERLRREGGWSYGMS